MFTANNHRKAKKTTLVLRYLGSIGLPSGGITHPAGAYYEEARLFKLCFVNNALYLISIRLYYYYRVNCEFIVHIVQRKCLIPLYFLCCQVL